jgi:hypothetical protein
MSNYSNNSECHKRLPSLNVVVHNCGFMIDVDDAGHKCDIVINNIN